MKYDWSTFTLYFYINATKKDVFNKWSSSSGLESFFIKKSLFINPNSNQTEEYAREGFFYKWSWFHGYESSGKFLKVIDHEFLSFEFEKNIVNISLKETKFGTQVSLTQSNINNDEESRSKVHLDCRGGWIYFLSNLKSVMEGGYDFRDKNVETAGSLNINFKGM